MDGTQRRTGLAAFGRVLRLEAHTLARRPELTWQQLHNRLQWDEEPVPEILAGERTRRRGPGSRPWLRTRFPFAESRALVRTLGGHSGPVFGCAVSPDSSFIVSVGADWTVRIWDAGMGVERARLAGHAELDTSGILVAPHPLGLNACAISPDGALIVSAGYKELKLWSVASGEELVTLPYENQARACAVSPDGAYFVSAGEDRTLTVWDLPAAEQRVVLEGHTGPVHGCAIAPDGSFVVSASRDGTVRLWDPVSGEERAALSGHGISFESGCAISPDGSFVVAPGNEGTLKASDVVTGEERATMRGHAIRVAGCAVSPDGSFVVSAGQDGTLRLWDSASGSEQAVLRGQGGQVNACAVSPDGSFIVSAGSDGTVKIWDPELMDEPSRPRWHAHAIRACAMSPDGSVIVSASDDGTARAWDAATGDERAAMEGHGAQVNGCAVSPDGSFVVTASGDSLRQVLRVGEAVISQAPPNAVRMWPFANGEPWRVGELPGIDAMTDLREAAEGSLYDLYRRMIDRNRRLTRLRELGAAEIILSAERKRMDELLRALLLKAAVGEEPAVLEGHSSQVNACAVSPDGSFVVSAGDDGALKIWDARSGEERGTLHGHTGPIADCAIGPDGSFLASAGGMVVFGGSLDAFDLTLRVWDLETLEERASVELTAPPMACAVSPDGSFVVSGSCEGALAIRDPHTLAALAALRGHGDLVTSCAVSADARLVVSGSRDGTLRIWDAPSGREVAVLPLPADVNCVAVDPRAPTVACGDQGGRVYVAELVGI